MLCLWYLLAAATIARDDSGLSPTCKACLIVSEGAANALRDRSSYTFGEVDDVVADFLEAHGCANMAFRNSRELMNACTQMVERYDEPMAAAIVRWYLHTGSAQDTAQLRRLLCTATTRSCGTTDDLNASLASIHDEEPVRSEYISERPPPPGAKKARTDA